LCISIVPQKSQNVNDISGILNLFVTFMTVPPVLDERIKGRQGYGLIQLIHGHGKGKTTAALGQAIRCAGAGKRVIIVYFDKGGTTHYSERAILDGIDAIDYVPTGRDRIDPLTGRFDFSITDEDRSEAARGLAVAREAMMSGTYDLVILDEINSTENLGMLKKADVLDALSNKGEHVEVVMTGRNPAQEFVDAAHLVTEMKLERHYFYSGVQAREGLDY
jgi:cob(I)alamin adenosyltransferase